MPLESCPFCGGKLQKKLAQFAHIYRGATIKIADLPHLICKDCGEELFDGVFGRIVEESIDQFRTKAYGKYDLLTSEEVAKLLAVSYQVVTTMLSDGKLPGTKIGREWRIPYGVLIDFIQSMSVDNLSQPELEIFQSLISQKKSFEK